MAVAAPVKEIAAAREAFREGDLALARRLLARVLAAQPRHSAANELMGYVEANQGNLGRAVECLRTATKAAGASPTAWYYLGLLCLRDGRRDEAEGALRRAVERDGHFFEALHDLGRVLHEKGEFPEAIDRLRQASALRPRAFEAPHNLGRSLQAVGRYEEALAEYDKAVALNAQSPQTWLNRGEVLHDLGRLDAALESYAKARTLRPDYPEAEANEALVRLAKGEWEAGWRALEARWSGSSALQARHAGIPRWTGRESVEGRRILVWSEQGFGDTIQFSRFIPRLLERGAEVVFEVQEPLRPLFEHNFACEVVGRGAQITACDWQIPTMSLPGAFGVRLENIPAGVPYLRATPEKAQAWRHRVESAGPGLRVAIACSGRSTHRHEGRRRVALAEFAPLARHARLFIVQKDLGDDDRAALVSGEVDAQYLGDDLMDFRDGAGILANVDLVVSIDTSIAHLAGAMAIPAWLALSNAPDGRWMTGREESPWYPTARLFRQDGPGDWSGVFRQIERALQGFSALRKRGD
jgi:Flp pilus assembly protein TadD